MRVLVGTESPEESSVYVTGINAPTKHILGTSMAIVPGDPEASQVYEGMGLRDLLAMPPVGTSVVDQEALSNVHDWISSLPPVETP